MKRLRLLALAALLLLAGCGAEKPITDGEDMHTYRQISQEEAKEMMRREDGHIVVDVRRRDEYDAGHIPGAILLPNEDIGTAPPAGTAASRPRRSSLTWATPTSMNSAASSPGPARS